MTQAPDASGEGSGLTIAVLKETVPGERRVALVPEDVRKLTAMGLRVRVEHGAGAAAFQSDERYAEAGAGIAPDAAAACRDAALVLKVRPPQAAEMAVLRAGQHIVCLTQALGDDPPARLAAAGIGTFALERVPRITRAQSMDVLSSQATVAGYEAVLLGASTLGVFMPMLMTAAGTMRPAKAFIIGVGVAGLQAIATARRLGAIVSAFDIRPATREQVQSLGATFVAAELADSGAEAQGGYARAQSDTEQERTLAAIGGHIKDMDLVVTTAQIPGRPAPRLITAAMVRAMRPGSVIVDIAAESGGNCELTLPGESRSEGGVTVIGANNLPSRLPIHASRLFSANMRTFLAHLIADGRIRADPDDEILRAMLIPAAATA